jgi:NADPH2:quinone reductase
MSQQRALLLHEVGKPLTLGDRPIPQPGENQLLVKVLVAGRKNHITHTIHPVHPVQTN